MEPSMTQTNRFLQLTRWFFAGRQDQMELSALRWWNRHRLGYNLRLIGCLLLGQVLILGAGYGEAYSGWNELSQRIWLGLRSNVALLVTANLLYFLLPWLETSTFKGPPKRFRFYAFTFINTVSVLFVVFALLSSLIIASPD